MLPCWTAASRLVIYLILVLTPVITEALVNLDAKDQFPYNLGRCFAVTAFTIIFLQVALAARLKWIERPFGLNLTFPFHRRMGVFAALLLLSHPVLLIVGGGGWHLALDGDWYIWVGKADPGAPPGARGDKRLAPATGPVFRDLAALA